MFELNKESFYGSYITDITERAKEAIIEQISSSRSKKRMRRNQLEKIEIVFQTEIHISNIIRRSLILIFNEPTYLFKEYWNQKNWENTFRWI